MPPPRETVAAGAPGVKGLVENLIHGANDPRVTVWESEQMEVALRRHGQEVRLVVFPDEGHRRDYGNWRNALRHYAEIEVFLARCLGGRVSVTRETRP